MMIFGECYKRSLLEEGNDAIVFAIQLIDIHVPIIVKMSSKLSLMSIMSLSSRNNVYRPL